MPGRLRNPLTPGDRTVGGGTRPEFTSADFGGADVGYS